MSTPRFPPRSARRAVALFGDEWAIAFEREGFCPPMAAEIRDRSVMDACAQFSLIGPSTMRRRSLISVSREDWPA